MAFNTGSIEKRFFEKIKETLFHGCWEWTAAKNQDGYGYFDNMRAHRYSYELQYGKIPDGALVLHSCDNPGCVSPFHLSFGTPLSNMQDKVSKGRLRNGKENQTHCKYGHELFGENLYINATSGHRQCKTCTSKICKENREKYNIARRIKRKMTR